MNYIQDMILFTGLSLIGWGIVMFVKAKETTRWAKTTGKIVAKGVAEGRATSPGSEMSSRVYWGTVTYEYAVAGREYTSDRVKLLAMKVSDPEEARRQVGAYREGWETEVYYDPDQPASAVLEPGGSFSGAFVIVFGAVLAAIGGWQYL